MIIGVVLFGLFAPDHYRADFRLLFSCERFMLPSDSGVTWDLQFKP